MFKKMMALYSPEEGETAGGAGGGETKETSGQEDVVPKTQFIAAINSANAKYNALEAKLNEVLAKQEAKPAIEQKSYTRSELNALVMSQQITQEQADAQMDYQLREEAKNEARRTALETVTTVQRKDRVDAEIAKYSALAPEILDDSHEVRQRIKGEYNYLISLGDTNSVETQLKAIRAVLGPVENLEKSRKGKADYISPRETGGGNRTPEKKDAKGLTYDTLSEREKEHYDKLISRGIYKDKTAVNEELKFVNANTRRKYGAMA